MLIICDNLCFHILHEVARVFLTPTLGDGYSHYSRWTDEDTEAF